MVSHTAAAGLAGGAARRQWRRIASARLARSVAWLATLFLAIPAGLCLAETQTNVTADNPPAGSGLSSVTPDSTSTAIAQALQADVNYITAQSPHLGGTLSIPGYDTNWQVDRPIYVGSPNITIAGYGRSTVVKSTNAFPEFILGAQQQYSGAAITAGHFPQTGGGTSPIFDTSVGTRYGLCTWDGTTSASGYFSECALAAGMAPSDPLNGTQITSYTYWAAQPTVTFDLCIENNGTGVMKGQILGIGAGVDRGSSLARSINSDKLSIFSLESDPSTGQNVRFKFRMVDGSGTETVQEIRILGNTSGADSLTLGQGTHRISVQVDFSTGHVASWYSLNSSTLVLESNQLVSGATITSTGHFKQFEWGAMRLGAVTTDPFSGTPSQGNSTDGNWTYAGIHIAQDARYNPTATLGTNQAFNTGVSGTLNDNFRYFSDGTELASAYQAIGYLPLNTAPSTPVVMHVVATNGNASNGLSGRGTTLGYWLPNRALTPQGGYTVRDISLICSSDIGSALIIAEVGRVTMANVICTNGSIPLGSYASVGSWNCAVPHCPVNGTNITLSGWDSAYLGISQNLHLANANTDARHESIRLVGCEGVIDSLLLNVGTDPGQAEYYIKVESGPYGGPLKITNFAPDNEGYNAPDKGWIYLEPSMNPTGGSNLVHVTCSGNAEVPENNDIFTLADPPNGGTFPTPKLLVEHTFPGSSYVPAQGFNSFVRVKSANWYGKIYDCSRTWQVRQWIYEDGITDAQCHIITYHDDYDRPPDSTTNPPSSVFQTTWIAGCHVIRIPDLKQNANGPSTHYTEYRCTTSGSFAGTAPVFTGYNSIP